MWRKVIRMSLRTHFPPRLLLFGSLLLVVILSFTTVNLAAAQTSTLTNTVRTLDGKISVRLPQGWMAQDSAASIFTSVIAFGDNAASLQDVLNSLSRTTTNPNLTRINGVIAIVNPVYVSGLPSQMAISALLAGIVQDLELSGGTVLEQSSIMLGGQYGGSLIVARTPAANATGFVGVFQSGNEIFEVMIGASPDQSFNSNRQLLMDILNSIRIPAEAASVAAAPQPTAPPITQSTAAESDNIARTAGGEVSAVIPVGWVAQEFDVIGFTDMLAFGDRQATVQALINSITASGDFGVAGQGGVIGLLDPEALEGQAPNAVVAPLMQDLVSSIQGNEVTILEPASAHTFGGQYQGQLASISVGYIAVFVADDKVVVSIVVSDNPEPVRPALLGVLESVRVPAQAAADQQPAAQDQPAGGGIGGVLSASVPAQLALFRAQGEGMSLLLPENWITLDQFADQRVIAFGDTQAAAESRLASARPDLATPAPFSGIGGLMIAYNLSDLGLTPERANVTNVLNQLTANLEAQGFRVTEAVQPMTIGGMEGTVVVVEGAEVGFLGLAVFDDQLAYITATGVNKNDFAANRALLTQIVGSVQMPAAAEAVPVEEPPAQGLGGLGGLLGATPAPEATPGS